MALRPLIALVAVTSLVTCTISNTTAQSLRPSIQQQIDLGQNAKKEIEKEYKVLPDNDPRVQELRRIGKKYVDALPQKEKEEKPFIYSFDVIEDDSLNAFALPGGPIYFFTGLLDKLESEDAVAGILGHEMVHIRNMHWASQYADNLKRKLGILVILSVLGANDTILDATDMLDSALNSTRYSRKHETESDRVGYDMMTGAGYNPQGMVDVFTILNNASKSKPPELISSHPDTERRIKDLEKRIKDDKRNFKPLMPRKGKNVKVTWTNEGWPLLSPVGKMALSPLP